MSPGHAPTSCCAFNGCTEVTGSNLTLSSLYSLRTKGKDMRTHCGRHCLPWRAMLNWNDLQRSVWNGSRLLMVTGNMINRYRADKRRTDRPDSYHHMIDRSTPVLHLWPNKNKHGLCALNYYYIYRVIITLLVLSHNSQQQQPASTATPLSTTW